MGIFEKPDKTIITDETGKDLELEPDKSVPITVKNQPIQTDITNQPIETDIVNQPIKTLVEDQVTRAFSVRMNKVILSYPTIILAQDTVINSYEIHIASDDYLPDAGHGIALFTSDIIPQLYFGTVLSFSPIGQIYPGYGPIYKYIMDTPLPVIFPSGPSFFGIFSYDVEMNVNGSYAPIIYSIPNIFQVAINITRIIPHILGDTGSAMDDAKFGNLPRLTNGVVFRKKVLDNSFVNYWNVHSNSEFRELAYDVTYVPAAPSGSPGFGCRLSYAGQHKHGVAIEILPGESVEFVIQDDLTDLNSFRCMFEGHANGA